MQINIRKLKKLTIGGKNGTEIGFKNHAI
jgi:hypothetical protein